MSHRQTPIIFLTGLILIVFLTGCQKSFPSIGSNPSTPPPTIDGENSGPVRNEDTIEPVMPNIYTNSKYHYSLKFPTDSKILNGCLGISDTECSLMTILDKAGKTALTIEVLDEKADYDQKVTDTIRLPLSDYAKTIWQFNKDDKNPHIKNKTVGQLEQTTIDGQIAYTFSLTGSYQDEREGFVLEDGFYTFIITRHQGAKYLLWFKTSCTQCQDILDTIEFTK